MVNRTWIILSMSESMDGVDGISIRSLLKTNFSGMTSLEIYAHNSAKIMEKTQNNMKLFKMQELNFHIDQSSFKVCMFEWVLKGKELYHMPKYIEQIVSVQKSTVPIFACGCKMLFVNLGMFELHIKKCELSGFILSVNVSRQLQNLPLLRFKTN